MFINTHFFLNKAMRCNCTFHQLEYRLLQLNTVETYCGKFRAVEYMRYVGCWSTPTFTMVPPSGVKTYRKIDKENPSLVFSGDPRVHRSSGKLGEASFPTGTVGLGFPGSTVHQ